MYGLVEHMSRRGIQLKFARLRRRLRQYEVADALGISPQRLSEMEAGRRAIDKRFFTRAMAVIRSQGEAKL